MAGIVSKICDNLRQSLQTCKFVTRSACLLWFRLSTIVRVVGILGTGIMEAVLRFSDATENLSSLEY